ncbi:hypothetical protein M2171_002579 [Bradyrhizobium japonicum USDA 38]|nr:hypothetical protein [Bradyrhizobium japonicum]MCS3893446.1 hypothetical protein [Bradyrhizobium japonicum USDA 38]MCS3945960.1 hypothetical protein [Bradyrhizobium japonicum]
MMYLLELAVRAMLAIVAGELREMPLRRRLADAVRSRLPTSAQRDRL